MGEFDEVVAYNAEAWDRQVEEGNPWTRPVGAEVIEAARRGDWEVVLIDHTPTPRSWLPADLAGVRVLCLASGGGQQGPVLAAAGASVTALDRSPRQLAQDRRVAAEHGLELRTVEGEMADLSALGDAEFDVVFHPVSNVFAPDVRPVWREAFRVLAPGGALLAGFMNPAVYMFDWELADRTGELEVCYPLPFADARDLPPHELAAKRAQRVPLEFSHSLEAQIGGQLEAGFVLTAFQEARRSPAELPNPLNRFMPAYIATRALKPG